MSTPLQRARTKLRVMYRLQQAAREPDGTIEEGHEPSSPVANGAPAERPQVLQHGVFWVFASTR
jgi:hypothetical protein